MDFWKVYKTTVSLKNNEKAKTTNAKVGLML